MLRHGIRRHDVEPQNDKVLSRRFGQEANVLGIGCLSRLLCARNRLPEGRSLTAVQHPVEKAIASWASYLYAGKRHADVSQLIHH